MKKLLLKLKELALKIKESGLYSFVKEHATWIILGGLAFYFLNPNYALFHNLMIIVVLFALALGLITISIRAMMTIKWIKQIFDPIPGKTTNSEVISNAIIIGAIILGGFILVAYSWSIVQYNEIGVNEKMYNSYIVKPNTAPDTIRIFE